MVHGVGSRIGRFELTEVLGAGGMGLVYRAHDSTLRRDVAIKILPPQHAGEHDRVERFAREARALAAFSHPHIAQIYGIEESDAGTAVVMELVPGRPLSAVRQQGGLGIDAALKLATQIALALDAAHEKGIVHRDLKPANIMVTPEGSIKVLDFGLAKIAAADLHGALTTMGAETAPGVVMGTVGYMSPEQTRGLDVDRRTDIWAFGCVLFELLAGRAPFERPGGSDTIAAILEHEPDWQLLPSATPPRVRRLIERCLQKDRRQRLRDIGDGLPELAGTATDVDPVPAGRSGRGVWMIAVGIAMALLAGLATGWGLRSGSIPAAGPERPVRFPVAPPPGTVFGGLFPPMETPMMAFSPDGSQLAFIATTRGKTSQVWIRNLDKDEAQAVPGTEHASSMFWSWDGQRLAFFAAGKLKHVVVAGGVATAICDVPLGVGLAGTWGAKGVILFASVQGDAIYRVTADGAGRPEPLVQGSPGLRVLWPHFLPDGRQFLYNTLGTDLRSDILLVDAAGQQRPLVQVASRAEFVEPDLLMFVRDATLTAQRVDLAAARMVGDPRSVAQIGYSAATGWANFTASPKGALAFSSHIGRSRIRMVMRSGRPDAELAGAAQYLSVRLARDGATMLFTRMRPEFGTYDIWTTTLADRRETRVTSMPGVELAPVPVPGTPNLVFSAASGTAPNIHVWDGTVPGERRFLESPRFQFPTDVTPDGATLIYQQRTELGNWDVLRVPIATPSDITPLFATAASEGDARISADGRMVAFVADSTGRSEVYVAPYDRPVNRRLASIDGGTAPRWRGDGRELFYLSPNNKIMSVPIGVDGKPERPAELFSISRWRDYDVMPDGSRFAVVIEEAPPEEQPLSVMVGWARAVGFR